MKKAFFALSSFTKVECLAISRRKTAVTESSSPATAVQGENEGSSFLQMKKAPTKFAAPQSGGEALEFTPAQYLPGTRRKEWAKATQFKEETVKSIIEREIGPEGQEMGQENSNSRLYDASLETAKQLMDALREQKDLADHELARSPLTLSGGGGDPCFTFEEFYSKISSKIPALSDINEDTESRKRLSLGMWKQFVKDEKELDSDFSTGGRYNDCLRERNEVEKEEQVSTIIEDSDGNPFPLLEELIAIRLKPAIVEALRSINRVTEKLNELIQESQKRGLGKFTLYSDSGWDVGVTSSSPDFKQSLTDWVKTSYKSYFTLKDDEKRPDDTTLLANVAITEPA